MNPCPRCNTLNASGSQFCSNCAAPLANNGEPKKKGISTSIAIIIAVVVIFGMCGIMTVIIALTQRPKPETAQVATTPTVASTATPQATKSVAANIKPTAKPTETPTPSTAGVNLENFNKLKTGMSYSQAVSILGKEGELLSENNMAGYSTVMYKWDTDASFSLGNMNAMFQNGKLISKSQFGLK